MPDNETATPTWLLNTVMREFAQRPGVQKTKLVTDFVNDILDIVLHLPPECLHAACMPKDDYDSLAEDAEKRDQELDRLREANDRLHDRITELNQENARLRSDIHLTD